MLSGAERALFVKVLAYTASPHDGERAAAAARAAEMLRSRGLEWSDVIAPALSAPSEPAATRHARQETAPTSTWSKRIEWLLRRQDFLTQFELQFVRSIAKQSRLSPKQAAVLLRAHNRVMEWEAR